MVFSFRRTHKELKPALGETLQDTDEPVPTFRGNEALARKSEFLRSC
jgi:hypothetical protein